MNSQELSHNPSKNTESHMRDIHAPMITAENGISTMRTVGILGLLYATSVLAQNAVFVISGAPDYRDSLPIVLAYHAQNAGAMSIATGLEGVNLVLLLSFLVGVHGLIKRRGGAGSDWSRLAMVTGSVLSVLFAMMIATHMTTVLIADDLIEPSPAFALIWRLHASIFALTLPALGVTLISAAIATHENGLTKSWQRVFALGGGSILILVGLGNLTIANGSPLVYVGVLGLAMWLVWIITTSLRFIRE